MKTAEEIISQYKPNSEYPSYYHESKIIEMIKEAHRQACEAQRVHCCNAFLKFVNSDGFEDEAIAIHQTPLIELK